MEARFYDLLPGCFLSEDSIGLAGGINPYAYVGNNPVDHTDPFGLAPCDTPSSSVIGSVVTGIVFTCGQGGGGFWGALGSALFGWALNSAVSSWMQDQWVAGGGWEGRFNRAFLGDDLMRCGHPEAPENGCIAYGILPSFVTPGGLRITGFTKHGINSAINHDGVGVTSRAILSTIRNPEKIVAQSGGRTKIIGQDAVLIVNKYGKIITTWARGQAHWRIQP